MVYYGILWYSMVYDRFGGLGAGLGVWGFGFRVQALRCRVGWSRIARFMGAIRPINGEDALFRMLGKSPQESHLSKSSQTLNP